MIELFSQEWNDTAITHEITLTSAQKEEIAKYDFLVTTNTQHLTARANAAYRVTCAFYVPHLLDFFNNSVAYDYYFGAGTTKVQTNYGSDYLTPYFKHDYTGNILYHMEVYSSGSVEGTSEIKFYGIKL